MNNTPMKTESSVLHNFLGNLISLFVWKSDNEMYVPNKGHNKV